MIGGDPSCRSIGRLSGEFLGSIERKPPTVQGHPGKVFDLVRVPRWAVAPTGRKRLGRPRALYPTLISCAFQRTPDQVVFDTEDERATPVVRGWSDLTQNDSSESCVRSFGAIRRRARSALGPSRTGALLEVIKAVRDDGSELAIHPCRSETTQTAAAGISSTAVSEHLTLGDPWAARGGALRLVAVTAGSNDGGHRLGVDLNLAQG